MMEISIERVTPQKARQWVEGGRNNRRTSEIKVKQYAMDMDEGRWRQNAVPIVFNEDGELMDGRHRMLALIEHGKPLDFAVARGVDDEAMATFDVGLARRLKDFLHLRGEEYAEVKASMVNMLWRFETYGTFAHSNLTQRAISISQALDYFDARAEEFRYAAGLGQSVRSHVPLAASLVGALYIIFSAINESDADDFMEKVGSGAALLPTDSVFLLRRRLIDNRGARDKLAQHVIAALAIKAWNAYRRGQPMQALSWRPGGKTPEPFPVPV